MSTYQLYNWSVGVSTASPFLAPEQVKSCLIGYRDDDPDKVITSYIKSVYGREITTASGSVYILHDISKKYWQWMKDNDIAYDPDNPIKMRVIK